MTSANIYTVSGSVLANDGLYIPRSADDELLELCRVGAFAYVLTSRQAGKSSLMDHTVRRLERENFLSLIIDLQGHGVSTEAAQWYYGLLVKMEEQVSLKTDIKKWWAEHESLPMAQRLIQYFKEVLLAEIETGRRVVVFVDEIDTTLGLGFTDDFFAAIRYLYSARSREPEFRRLSFVLVGVATPSDLISNPKRTPFNIGQHVRLTDFTFDEALPLATGLGMPAEAAQRVLRYVLEWTGGHPCLTQRLCKAIADEGGGECSKEDVDRIVAETFFGAKSHDDDHLQFVRDMLLRRAGKLREHVLTTYRDILRGREVADEERSPVKSHLKLSGIVRREDGTLRVRNPLYRHIFDEAFLKQNLLTNWPRVAARAAMALIILCVLVAAGLAPYAWTQKDEAEKSSRDLADANRKLNDALASEKSARAEAQQRRDEAERSSHDLADANRKLNDALASERSARAEADAQRLLAEQGRAEADQQRRLAIEARNEATEAAARAEAQRSDAEVARDTAERATGEAMKQKDIAEAERWKAETARDEAEQLRKQLEQLHKLATGGQLVALAELTRNQSDNLIQLSARMARESIEIAQTSDAPTKEAPLVAYQSLLRSLTMMLPQVLQASHPKGRSYGYFTPDGARFVTLTSEVEPDKQSNPSNTSRGQAPQAVAVVKDEPVPTTLTALDVSKKQSVELKPKQESWVQPSAAGRDIKYLVTPSRGDAGTLLTVTRALTGEQVGQVRAEGEVRHVSVGRDGQSLAAASAGGSVVQVWDLASHREVRLKPDSQASHVYLSPSGKYLAAAGEGVGLAANIVVWDVAGEKTVASVPRSGTFKQVLFSPNDELFFVETGKDSRLYEVVGGKQVLPRTQKEAIKEERGQSEISKLAFSPDGMYLVAIRGNYGVQVMPARRGASILVLPDTRFSSYTDVTFSPDSKYLATFINLDSRGGSIVEVWHSETLLKAMASRRSKEEVEKVGSLRQNMSVKFVKFSPDNNYLALVGADNIVRLWNIKVRPDLFELASLLGMTPYGSGDRGKITQIVHEGSVSDISFSPDSKLIVTVGEDGSSRIWKLDSEDKFIRRILQVRIDIAVFSPDGKYLVTVKGEAGNEDSSRERKRPEYMLRVFDITRRYAVTLERRYSTPLDAVTFSADGKYLALLKDVGKGCDSVEIWELSGDGSEWRRFGAEIKVNDASFLGISVGGRYIATAGRVNNVKEKPGAAKDASAIVWKVEGAEPNKAKNECANSAALVYRFQLNSEANSLAFSPDGNRLAVASPTGGTTLLNIANGKQTPVAHQDGAVAVAFSPDGKYVVTAGAELQISELATGRTKRLEHDKVTTVAFSPDGRYLASAGTDETARVWDIGSWTEVTPPLKHGESVNSVTFDPGSTYLATMTDNTIRVLDIANKQEVARIPRSLFAPLRDKISFSPDGKYLNEVSDEMARAWLWRLSDLLEESCSRLTVKEPTLEEWGEHGGKALQQYFSNKKVTSFCRKTQ